MATLIPLVKLHSIPDGAGRRVFKNGLDIAIFRIGEAAYAIDDSCPHSGASLSSGRLQGKTVMCTAHGLRFDIECDRPGGPPTLPVTRFPVQIVDGVVMLETQ
jgi:3-phenylpropionate/trans-cinnamate dioxygenase ferredoxin subunit